MHICNQFLFEDKKTVTFVGCILSVRGMFNVVVPIWRNIIGVLYQIVDSGQCPCPDCIFAMQGSHLRRSPAATHRCLAPCLLPLLTAEGVPLIVNFKSSLPCGDTGRVQAAVLQCCSATSAATTRPSQDIEKLLAIFGQLYWYIEGYLQFCAVATTTLHSLQCVKLEGLPMAKMPNGNTTQWLQKSSWLSNISKTLHPTLHFKILIIDHHKMQKRSF